MVAAGTAVEEIKELILQIGGCTFSERSFLMQLYVPEALKENEDPKLGNVAENSDVQIGFGL